MGNVIKLLFSSFLFFTSVFSYSQANQEWLRNYTIQNWSAEFGSIAVDNSGSVYVTGYATDNQTSPITTVKYNSLGVFQWAKTFSSVGNSDPVKIAIDHSGNIYIAAKTSGFCLVKYTPNGNLIWSKELTIGDWMRDIVIDNSNNVYFTGGAFSASTNSEDFYTAKYDSAGVLKWASYYNNQSLNSGDVGYKMKVDSSGNVYVAGMSYYMQDGYSTCTVKYSSLGVQLWANRLDRSNVTQSEPTAIDVDNLSNVYVAGYFANDYPKLQLIKIKPGGDTAWVKLFEECSNHYDEAADMKVFDNNSIFVSGWTVSCSGITNFTTIRYDSSGSATWLRRLNLSGYESSYSRSMFLDSLGNSYITGYCVPGQINQTPYICSVKYDINGNLIWSAVYNAFKCYEGIPILISRYNRNFFYVATSTQTANNGLNSSYTVIKYSEPIGIHTTSSEIPKSFSLYQNYPNPFNPTTKIKFDIPQNGPVGNAYIRSVKLVVYDITGREVETLVNEQLKPGTYEVSFDAANYSSGVYFYKLATGDYSATNKMILVK